MDENLELTSKEWGSLLLAFPKIMLIHGWVKAGLPVQLNSKNFGFPDDISLDEEAALVEKLFAHQQIAWLRETRVDIESEVKKDG